jgi:hypothetical protein
MIPIKGKSTKIIDISNTGMIRKISNKAEPKPPIQT